MRRFIAGFIVGTLAALVGVIIANVSIFTVSLFY